MIANIRRVSIYIPEAMDCIGFAVLASEVGITSLNSHLAGIYTGTRCGCCGVSEW